MFMPTLKPSGLYFLEEWFLLYLLQSSKQFVPLKLNQNSFELIFWLQSKECPLATGNLS
jgi:hypothetical protein